MPQTVAILMPGDMGHGVGQALREHGHDVVTSLAGRSANTRTLAETAGIRDTGSLDAAVEAADLVLSILPPDRALDQAEAVAAAMARTGARPVYADCNAISPMTAVKVGNVIAVAGATFIDCGIIGWNPIKAPPTRFYVSGPDCAALEALDSDAIMVRRISGEIGKASALKMVYAAMTKGTWALQIALMLAAGKHGVLDALMGEWAISQKGQLEAMRNRIPFIPADAARWVPEMEEIAATFDAAGVTPHFHEGAAEIYRILARTPFAAETRATLDTDRTLEEALEEYLRHV